MAKFRIRYFVSRPNADGTPRYYWQPDKTLRLAGWKMRRLSGDRSAAMAEAEDINQAVDQWRANTIIAPVNEKPGSIDAVIASYKNSRHFSGLAEKTQRDYAYYLSRISEWAGDMPAGVITAKMVQNLYEQKREESPRKAAYLIQVLRLLFSHAERESIIPKNTNPATRPKLDYRAGKGVIWTPEQVRLFVTVADDMKYFSIGTAVMLNEWLGQRRGDLLRLPVTAVRDGNIHIRQNKTGAEVILPISIVPDLLARVEQQIAQNKKRKGKIAGTTLIQQTGGGVYHDDGFMSAFERIRNKAAETDPTLRRLVFKDLRHTAVTRLAESGVEIPMIASVTGHTFKSCQDIVDRYNIRTAKMAREAFTRRHDAEQRNAERKENT